jgi:hypothetical protein
VVAVASRRKRTGKAKPGPVCGVCSHRDREAIDRALVEGESAPKIAAKYRRLSDDTVRRHAENHLPARLVLAADAKDSADAGRVIAQLERCLERVNLLFDACDRWLRDPDDPTRYDVGPRAEDVRVTYVEQKGEHQPVRLKARLSELLQKVAKVAPDIRLVETKHADPRELVLAAAKRLDGHTELLARLVGQLKDSPGLNVNVILSPQWITLRTVLLGALEPYPDARLAVAQAIEAYAARQ